MPGVESFLVGLRGGASVLTTDELTAKFASNIAAKLFFFWAIIDAILISKEFIYYNT